MSVREIYEVTSDLYDMNGNQIIEEDPSFLNWLTTPFGIGKMFCTEGSHFNTDILALYNTNILIAITPGTFFN